jgi:FixJ family two-component response regulator
LSASGTISLAAFVSAWCTPETAAPRFPRARAARRAATLAARATPIPVVVLSGRGAPEDFVGSPVAVWLMKPFAKEQLLRAVKRVFR